MMNNFNLTLVGIKIMIILYTGLKCQMILLVLNFQQLNLHLTSLIYSIISHWMITLNLLIVINRFIATVKHSRMKSLSH